MLEESAFEPLPAQVDDELAFLLGQADLRAARVLEVGCGAGAFGRRLIEQCPQARYTGIEADARQHAVNVATQQPALRFVFGRGEALPLGDSEFDAVLMLKSLHHVPAATMARALDEAWRVLAADGVLYVSEPVFSGPFNEIVRLFHDEQVVRAQAQQALAAAGRSARWAQCFDHRFLTPLSFTGFADFKRRIIDATYQDHALDDALLQKVKQAFDAHVSGGVAHFVRPMRVHLLRKQTHHSSVPTP